MANRKLRGHPPEYFCQQTPSQLCPMIDDEGCARCDKLAAESGYDGAAWLQDALEEAEREVRRWPKWLREMVRLRHGE